MFLNQKALNLKQGAIRNMFDRAQTIQGIISMGIGEPDLITPMAIINAGIEALNQGHTHYTPNAGTLELRRRIAGQESLKPMEYDPNKEIIVTNGGMGALSLCMQVILEKGDEVLIQDPQWLNYASQIEYCDGKVIRVPVQAETNFTLMPEDIETRVTARTKALIINSPNNPTGMVMDYHSLEAIAALSKKHNFLIISDEVYSTLTYDGTVAWSIASLPGVKERTIVINSFSKAYAMTGWRIGYACGPDIIIDKMIKVQENFSACANAPGQYAAAYAITRPDIAEELRQIFQRRRHIVLNELSQIQGLDYVEPNGGFYVFPSIKKFGLSSEEFCNRLLDKEKVVCIPGSAFGPEGEGYIRLCYTNNESQLTEALRRIRCFCQTYTAALH